MCLFSLTWRRTATARRVLLPAWRGQDFLFPAGTRNLPNLFQSRDSPGDRERSEVGCTGRWTEADVWKYQDTFGEDWVDEAGIPRQLAETGPKAESPGKLGLAAIAEGFSPRLKGGSTLKGTEPGDITQNPIVVRFSSRPSQPGYAFSAVCGLRSTKWSDSG